MVKNSVAAMNHNYGNHPVLNGVMICACISNNYSIQTTLKPSVQYFTSTLES